MFLIPPTPNTHCFLSPSQHEVVSTLEAKIPRNYRFFDKKKQRFTSTNKAKKSKRLDELID